MANVGKATIGVRFIALSQSEWSLLRQTAEHQAFLCGANGDAGMQAEWQQIVDKIDGKEVDEYEKASCPACGEPIVQGQSRDYKGDLYHVDCNPHE